MFGSMHSRRDRRMTKPVARRPLHPTGVDGMGPAADETSDERPLRVVVSWCRGVVVSWRRGALPLAPWRS